MKPSGWPNYARSCASASRFLSLVAFVALLIASPSSARAAAPAVKTGPPVRTAASPRAVAPAPMPQAAAPGPRIWLGAAKPLSTNYVGANAPAQSGTSGRALTLGGNPGPGGALPHQILSSGQATPLALVSGDFNEDGYADLAVGYASAGGGIVAIHRGNIDAFAPQSDASFQAIAHGNFPPSFLPDAQVFSVPVRPDFIATGKFTVNGHQDLVIGANGGTTLYVLAGDGKGNFAAPEMVALPGGLTVLAAGHLGGSGVFTALVAGISIPGQQSDLVVMHGSEQGLTPLKVLALDGPASNIVFGDFGSGPDAAFLAGGQTVLLHSSRMELETLQLPVSATALTVGDFINDRDPRVQLALLASDGSVYIAAHNSFDPRPFTQDEWQIMRQATVNGLPNPLVPASPANEGWKIVETVPSASIYSGQVPVFFRTRISGNAADDVMVLNASAGELTLISHPNLAAGATTFLPGQVSVRPYNAKPVAAIPLRNNIDGRPGVIALHQGETVPQALTPLPDPTFNVDTTNDVVVANACNPAAPIVGSCSLREAIIEANATPGVDTIMVPAGTYTLTIADGGTDKHDATTGELSITDGVNIVGFLDGSGNPVSIIQACSVLPTPIATTPFATCGGTGIIEKPFSVNPGFTKAFDTAFTNLEIRFGFNPGTFAGDGFGGGFDWEASKTGTMTVTSCNIHDNRIHDGRGAGITATNTGGGTGQFTMSNSTVANNVASRTGTNSGSGGGIFFGSATRFTITNTHIDNNQAINGNSEGGGIFAFNPGTTPISVIHGGTISGNSAITRGGGVRSSAGITIDQGTIISGNTAGEGAGVWSNLGTSVPFPAGETTTLNKVAITGNNATGNGTLPTPGIGGGGGIKVDNSASGNFFVMSFSRLAGNTSALGGSNLFSTSPGAAVTATNNWWGTNAAASTIGGGATVNCPTPLAGQICFDPFIVLTHSASPAIIRINQSTTLTGDMSQDNHGTALVLTNLNRILGRPITFDAPVLGTIPDAQPENLDANAQATATFNAGGVSGRGSAHATVDQAIISANSNLIASATESTTTVTITTVGTHNFAVGETVVISGVGVGGYNGTFAITATTPTTFNYTTTAGLGASSGGLANVGILILEPLHITKSFNPTPVATNTSSTLTFSVTNPNVIAVDSSFTDTLPANLVVANPPGTTNTCGGTFAPAAGDTSLTFTNGTLGVGSCAISVNVTSAVDNIYSNSVTINSTAAGTGAASTSSANLTVINPPTINKVFGAATIPLNGTTSLTFTISSSNQNQTLSGIGFTDSLPSGLVVATPNGLTNTCSTTPTAVAGSGTVSLTGASLAPGASCTISVNVQGTTAGLKSNSVTVSDTIAGTGNTSSTSLTVVAPPTISKAFNPTSIPLNGTSTLTFTINNPNTTAAADLTGVAFSDTLPLSSGSGSATLVVSSTPNVSNTCGGTVTATAGTGVISLSGASVAHNASCTLSVDVKGTVEGDGNNTTGAITSTEGGTGTTSNTALLKVVAPPTISKAFGAASIPLNGTTTVTFTIANPASNTSAESGIAFSDTLTNGLQVASTPGVSNTCNGTVTATANSTSISLSGGSIGTPGTTCTIVVNVTGTVAGSVSNTTGAVSSTNGGTGATSNTATLLVVAPATVIKTFAPTKIPLNGTTLLTINITNPNSTVSLTGLSFTDSLPAGLVVASTPNLNNTCGGTATATGGSSSVTLSGGTVASSASCAVSVNVQGTTAGDKINNVVVSSTEGGASTGASATVTVVAPPTISKAFNPTSVARNGTSTVTFTISNPNNPGTPANGDLTGVAFSDTLPVSSGPGSATLAVAATPSVSNTCGGTVTATAGTGVISLSGASVAHNSSCTVSVNVTGTVEGDGNNTTGAISSTEGGTGTTSNTATLNVVAPPTISKAFGAANITLNGTTTVTFTITNPASNTSAENGIAFSDTLTNGLQVASTPGVSNTCGGTVTAAANSTSISLTGGSIATPGATCTVVVNVTGTQSGTVTNTTGAVSSTNGGTGATSNTATLIVASPATVTKTFAPTKIPLNGTTLLTINITNPNSNVSLTGLSFTDSLPAGLAVASPANLNNTCGGTATATAGAGTVSLSGGTVASSASCAVSVNVQGTTAGDKLNSVTVSSTEGGASTAATATVTVVAPATISKAFNPTSIPKNGTSTITFTISNPNNPGTPSNGDLTGVAFSDTLPVSGGAGSATLVVAGTPNVSNTCGGTVTATAGSGVISLSGGSVAHNTSCTLSVDVKGTVEGDGNNTTGAISSTEGGTGTTSNTATLKVVAPPAISKAFGAANITLNGTTTVTFTMTNPASNTSAENGIAFSDTLTNGLQVASTPGVTNSCGGTVTAAANSTSISLTGGSIATPGATCTVVVNVTGTQSGTVTNTTGAVSSTNGGTGATSNTATLTVALPPTSTKQFTLHQIPLNGTTTLTINITNPNTNVTLTGIAFTDSLPSGLQVAPTPNGSNTCGGAFNPAAGAGSITLSGGTLAVSASCTVRVDVQGTTGGVKNNSVTVTSTEGGSGTPSSDSITVVAPPVLTKGFGALSVPLGGSTSLTFNVSDPNSTVGLSGIGFSDTLPAGLVISTPNGLTTTCNGTMTAAQATSLISLSGATLAASGSCTFSVNVTGTTAGTQNNTTGAITSVEGGTGAAASASIAVVAPPSIAKAFNPNGIQLNGVSTLTITITNPAANGVPENGVAFTDNFPANLVVATPSGVTTTCGGTPTATAGSGTVSLSGGTVAANSSCSVTVNVTSSVTGSYLNSTGPVSSTNGGTGGSASATLTVAFPPTISKVFVPDTIFLGAKTVVSFTITNPNSSLGTPPPNDVTLTGIAFTDALPAGLTVAATPNVSNNCDGVVTAVAGSNSITLSGGDLGPAGGLSPVARRNRASRLLAQPTANGSCFISVSVTPASTGTFNNTTGPISANESGPGAASNTATLTVNSAPLAPVLTKVFGATSVPLNGTTSLTFTVSNPNSGSPQFVNASFSDALPAGLVVANPSNLGGTCITNPGNGADVTANPGSGSITVAALSLPVSSSCTITLNVTGTTAGTKNNVTSAIAATFDDGVGTFVPITGGTASASLAVVAPPAIAKSFTPALITPGATSVLSFTITSPAGNTVALAGVAFTDTLPANVLVATPNGQTGSCGGGTITATAGTGSVSLTGASFTGSCTFAVNVTSATPGTYTNTTSTVTSTNGGTGNTATATLTVSTPNLSITKTHVGNFTRGGTGSYTITVSNNATAGPTVGTVTVIDTLPVVTNPLTPISMSGTGWTCSLAVPATPTCTRSDVLAPGASYPAITLTVNVPQNITANVINSVAVSGGGDPNSHTANDPTHIGAPIQISSHGGNLTVIRGGQTSADFTVDASPGDGAITFACSGLPAGVTCSFNPPSENQISATVTMIITSNLGNASIPQDRNSPIPLYAFSFPVLGLVGVCLGGRKARKIRLRMALLFAAMLVLLALSGCGGGSVGKGGTPPGVYTFTMNATSATGDTGSTQLTLTVLSPGPQGH